MFLDAEVNFHRREQQQERAPEQGMESGILQEESNLRSSSSMTLHPRGALRAGEALQLLQGGDGQPMEEVEQGQRRRLPEGAEESARKSQRLGENTAVPEPKAKRGKTLYRPTFAGQVRQVIEDVEIYVDEEPVVDSQIEDEFDQIDLTELSEKDGPPEVSGEQLKVLDREAMMKEVEKLKAICSIPTNMSADDALQLDTKNVLDWRYRQNQWTRRCRIVALEFKDSVSTVDTFAPTTPWRGVRTFLAVSSDEAQGCSV